VESIEEDGIEAAKKPSVGRANPGAEREREPEGPKKVLESKREDADQPPE